jgi:hypothetical protein
MGMSDNPPRPSDEMYGFHGAGFDSTTPESQPNAEPVAWRWRYKSEPGGWHFIVNKFEPNAQHIMEPLFTTPPRPDVSTGLIEAAEMAEEHASKHCYDSQVEQGLLRNFAQFLRARAADKGGK